MKLLSQVKCPVCEKRFSSDKSMAHADDDMMTHMLDNHPRAIRKLANRNVTYENYYIRKMMKVSPALKRALR